MGEKNNRVSQDQVFLVPIENGELYISAEYDVVFRFRWLGAAILRYWSQEEETMHDIMLTEEGVEYLQKNCRIDVIERDWIGKHRYEKILEWQSENLEIEFGDGSE